MPDKFDSMMHKLTTLNTHPALGWTRLWPLNHMGFMIWDDESDEITLTYWGRFLLWLIR